MGTGILGTFPYNWCVAKRTSNISLPRNPAGCHDETQQIVGPEPRPAPFASSVIRRSSPVARRPVNSAVVHQIQNCMVFKKKILFTIAVVVGFDVIASLASRVLQFE